MGVMTYPSLVIMGAKDSEPEKTEQFNPVLVAAALEAIKVDAWALKTLPIEMRSYDMCYEAVKHVGVLLRNVPMQYRDREMCRQAVISDNDAIKFVPKDTLIELVIN